MKTFFIFSSHIVIGSLIGVLLASVIWTALTIGFGVGYATMEYLLG